MLRALTTSGGIRKSIPPPDDIFELDSIALRIGRHEEVYCPPDQIAGPREILLRRCIQSALGSVYFIPMTAGAPWSYLIGILSDSSSGGPIPSAPAGPPEEVYCPPDHIACPREILERRCIQSGLSSNCYIPMTAGAPWS